MNYLIPTICLLSLLLSCTDQSGIDNDSCEQHVYDNNEGFLNHREIVCYNVLPSGMVEFYDSLAISLGAERMIFSAETPRGLDTIWLAEALFHPWDDRSTSLYYSDEGSTPEEVAKKVIMAIEQCPIK